LKDTGRCKSSLNYYCSFTSPTTPSKLRRRGQKEKRKRKEEALNAKLAEHHRYSDPSPSKHTLPHFFFFFFFDEQATMEPVPPLRFEGVPKPLVENSVTTHHPHYSIMHHALSYPQPSNQNTTHGSQTQTQPTSTSNSYSTPSYNVNISTTNSYINNSKLVTHHHNYPVVTPASLMRHAISTTVLQNLRISSGSSTSGHNAGRSSSNLNNSNNGPTSNQPDSARKKERKGVLLPATGAAMFRPLKDPDIHNFHGDSHSASDGLHGREKTTTSSSSCNTNQNLTDVVVMPSLLPPRKKSSSSSSSTAAAGARSAASKVVNFFGKTMDSINSNSCSSTSKDSVTGEYDRVSLPQGILKSSHLTSSVHAKSSNGTASAIPVVPLASPDFNGGVRILVKTQEKEYIRNQQHHHHHHQQHHHNHNHQQYQMPEIVKTHHHHHHHHHHNASRPQTQQATQHQQSVSMPAIHPAHSTNNRPKTSHINHISPTTPTTTSETLSLPSPSSSSSSDTSSLHQKASDTSLSSLPKTPHLGSQARQNGTKCSPMHRFDHGGGCKVGVPEKIQNWEHHHKSPSPLMSSVEELKSLAAKGCESSLLELRNRIVKNEVQEDPRILLTISSNVWNGGNVFEIFDI
jgi:hypothetical protein